MEHCLFVKLTELPKKQNLMIFEREIQSRFIRKYWLGETS